MKTLLFLLAFSAASALAYNTSPSPKKCTATKNSHLMTVTEVAGAVQVGFEEVDFVDWGTTDTVKKYTLSGKALNVVLIHGVTLTEILKNTGPLTSVLVSILRSRPEFDGEADMSYADASAYIRAMVCR